MDNSKIPAVIVECGFLSNPEEEVLLSDIANSKATIIYLGSDNPKTAKGKTIFAEAEKVQDKNISGISFLCGHRNGQLIGQEFPSNGIYNGIDIRFKYKVWGDKAEVWKTDILKKYHFPEFEGENFVSENYIWRQIAMEYDMMYVNKIIYLAEYLEGGLSSQGRKLIIGSPRGAMEVEKVSFSNKYPMKERIKRTWTYICYGKFAGMSFKSIAEKSGNKLLVILNYPFGLALHCYWKHLYKNEDDERNKNA